MRCANECAGDPGCVRLACCHECLLYARAECTNDGTLAFTPRYFGRLAFV